MCDNCFLVVFRLICMACVLSQYIIIASGRNSSSSRSATKIFTSCINFLQTGRISLLKVAENIITCLPCGVLRKISCTSRRISVKEKSYTYRYKLYAFWKYIIKNLPSCSNILSHSSRTKCFKCFRFSFLLRMSAKIRPGVPTTMWGVPFFKVSSSFWIARPPKNTATCPEQR